MLYYKYSTDQIKYCFQVSSSKFFYFFFSFLNMFINYLKISKNHILFFLVLQIFELEQIESSHPLNTCNYKLVQDLTVFLCVKYNIFILAKEKWSTVQKLECMIKFVNLCRL